MTKFKILAWLAVMTLLLSLPAAVLAQPVMPPVFAGTAMLDGEPAPDGTNVTAWIGDTMAAQGTVNDGTYAFAIPQAAGDLFNRGDTIAFMIGDFQTLETAKWEGDGEELNLTASSTMMMRGSAAVEQGVLGVNNVLVDSNGKTLYLFTKDVDGVSACTSDACLTAWPLVTSDGDPTAGRSIDQALLGTSTHANGASQATYAGNPLYHNSKDLNAGDAMGQGFAGVWWVVSPDGTGITGAGTAGADGAQGDQGDAGAAGNDGINGGGGAKGKDGADGADGKAGSEGKAGAGSAGEDGAAGKDGAVGNDGAAGGVGAAGKNGAVGPTGGSGLAIVALIIAIVAAVGAGGAFVMGRRS